VTTTIESFSTSVLSDLLRHMQWADASVWRAVLPHEGARTDRRLRDLLTHLHLVQRLFLLVWRGDALEAELTSFKEFGELEELHRRVITYYPEFTRFLDTLEPSSMSRGVVMPFVAQYEKQLGRTFGVPTLAETMFQVTSHSTYHRGQVNARLREVGGEPPLVDYIAWIWFGRPEAEWVRTP
jgi:uncharacterized damage-inducible protein DinB